MRSRRGSRHWPEIEDALVPAFIIEELDDRRLTVFVPSVPTPFAGAVYVLRPERVHILEIPFTQAIRSISRWGSGSKDLVAAMGRGVVTTLGDRLEVETRTRESFE